jgi:DNA-binding SARP family transcriptional activator
VGAHASARARDQRCLAALARLSETASAKPQGYRRPRIFGRGGGVTVAAVSTEFRVLGPLEALADGAPVKLGGSRPRAVLAVLLLHAGQVLSTSRLIDEVWAEDPPDTAANVVQGYVSQLRKELGRESIETHDPGYLLRIEHDSLDLHRFERLVSDGTELLERGRAEDAAVLLRESLALWRGPALANVAEEGVLSQAAARLDELRLMALERRIEADLACGRHSELVGELDALATGYPLRERPRALQMLALYRCGRQADALAAYRLARATLVDQLGIEPGAQLQELERAILQHDPALDLEPARRRASESRARIILVAALELEAAATLMRLAEPLARIAGPHEIVLASTVASASELVAASAYLRQHREELSARDVDVRAAAFTSVMPGKDLSLLAAEQDAELVLVDAPDQLLDDGRLLMLLEDAPCDVSVLVDGAPGGDAVVVPFTGAEHDWSAVELGAWFALGTELPLVLAGASSGAQGGDASRVLASASLAIQRAFGVHAEPLLVEPTAEALVAATHDAAVVIVGLTDRWRRDGIGHTRAALAASSHHPTLIVRGGLRPGGLGPRSSETRFTWTVGQSG